MRTRVKICGITRLEDALAAADAGADAIGFVFEERSPRFIEPQQARAIALALPPFLTIVGLFVDAPAERIRQVLTEVPLGLLQFHGQEDPGECRQYGRPYLKAVHMRDGSEPQRALRLYQDALALVFDAYSPEAAGGIGRRFDWRWLPQGLGRRLILAGGLTSENVAEAIREVRPFAVDVSSGVECSKGIKDAARIDAFMRSVTIASGGAR
ncbi:MAG: phosphoribosylanthranilate isomerase [Acidiferrobacterales bacterium]